MMANAAKLDEKIAVLEAEVAEASAKQNYSAADKAAKQLKKLKAKRERLALREKKRTALKQKERKFKRAVVKEPKDSTTHLIGYEMLFEDGIMRVDSGHYSIALAADDVNYMGARADEQADVRLMWADYLNSLEHTVKVQPCLLNRHIGSDELSASLAMTPIAGDDLGNALRAEFEAYCADRLAQASKSMRRTRIVVITVDAPTREKAAPILAREAERFIRLMRDLSSDARVLSGQERIDAICAYTHPKDAAGTVGYADLEGAPGLTTRDLVAPNRVIHLKEAAGDARMIVGDTWVKTYVMGLDGYGTTMRDTFICDLSSLPYNIGVTWHIRPWETAAAVSAAEAQLYSVTEENNAYKVSKSRPDRGYFIDDENMPTPMREAQEEAQALRDDLVRNDMRNFSVTTTVCVMGADADELEEACREVESVFGAHRKAIPDAWSCLREQAYSAVLPVGNCSLPYDRTLTTAPVANMLMWASAELMDDGGMLMGINPSTRNFILYDPALYEHSNSFTLAMPRGGKSVNAKLTRIIQNRLRHPDDDIIVIDPEAEYVAVTTALGGQTINLSETSGDHVNPLDISAYYGSDNPGTMVNPIPSKVSFIQAMVRMMARGISDAQVNLLDQAARIAYSAWASDPRPENLPTLQTIYDHLSSVEGQSADDAKRLAQLIDRYVEGTLSVFNHPTNVEISNRLVDFVLADLSIELKPIAMLILLDHIWVRVSANRKSGRRTWLVIDEFQLLLDDPATVATLDRFFTRGRKWDLYISAITQNISRLLDFEQTRYMLQNSPFLTIMNQSPDAARELGELLTLSESQVRFIRTCSPGQGIYVTQNAVVPFDFTISERVCPTLYSIVTTSPADIKRMMSKVGAGRRDFPMQQQVPDRSPGNELGKEASIEAYTPVPVFMTNTGLEGDAARESIVAEEPESEPQLENTFEPDPDETAPGVVRGLFSSLDAQGSTDVEAEGDHSPLDTPSRISARKESDTVNDDPGRGDWVDELIDGAAPDADFNLEIDIESESLPYAEANPFDAAARARAEMIARTTPARERRETEVMISDEEMREHVERMRDSGFRKGYAGLCRAYEDGSADPSEFGYYEPQRTPDGESDFIE